MNCEHRNKTSGTYKGRCNDCGAEGKLFRKVKLRDEKALPRCLYTVDGKPCDVYAPIGQDYCREQLWKLANACESSCCTLEDSCLDA